MVVGGGWWVVGGGWRVVGGGWWVVDVGCWGCAAAGHARTGSRVSTLNPPVPTTLPRSCASLMWSRIQAEPTAIRIHSTNTTVEWPRENQRPTVRGRFPSLISLRVTLSMASVVVVVVAVVVVVVAKEEAQVRQGGLRPGRTHSDRMSC